MQPGTVLFLFILALLISVFVSFLLGKNGPWGGFWTFFIILFLAVWVSDIWLPDIGPSFNNFFWLPPLTTGLLIALLLVISTPSPTARSRVEKIRNDPNQKRSALFSLGVLFWIILILLILAVVIGLLFNF